MFRKITMTVVPVAALALMLCASNNSDSQAFAKGGMYGHGIQKFDNHRNFHNRYYGRYFGYGYPSYCGYEAPTCAVSVCQPVAPVVCEPVAPVVAQPVVPVCTTCEPACVGTYGSSWGYGRFHREHRDYRFHPLGERGHGPVRR